MANPMIREHNTETDEIIDREMTEAEATDYIAQLEMVASKKAEAESLAIAKAAALAKLGLTAEELAAVLS